MNIFCRAVLAATILLAPIAIHSQESTGVEPSGPVKVVADHQLKITTDKGTGVLPFYISRDWTKPQPDVTRALLIFHGRLRNADVYYASGQQALASAGAEGKKTILIAPQFLQQEDIDAHHLPPSVLRWSSGKWMDGHNAIGPAPISTFTAIDAILERLADRTIFPNLKVVVLGGHSAGGQIMQRYTVVNHGEDALVKAGVHVRYVIANPSSYLYFSNERPVPGSTTSVAPFKDDSCKEFNKWKYGVNDPPAYVGKTSFADLEAAYAKRDVIYLLGGADVDPNHPALDKSCSGEAEGPFRLARGKSYFHYMQARHPNDLNHKAWLVPGVAHDGDKMFNSSCGLTALFDIGTCKTPIK